MGNSLSVHADYNSSNLIFLVPYKSGLAIWILSGSVSRLK